MYPNNAKKKTAPALIVFAAALIVFSTALVIYSTFRATGVEWAQSNAGVRMTDNNIKWDQSRPTRTLSFILSRE